MIPWISARRGGPRDWQNFSPADIRRSDRESARASRAPADRGHPHRFRAGKPGRRAHHTERLDTQFNLPNMIDGGLAALFFIVYVGQTREAQNPDAFTAAGYERAH